MAKSKQATPGLKEASEPAEKGTEGQTPTFRERLELILFLVVEILCLLLFIDFLFVGYYVK